jgi:hypothetical protein
VTGRACDPKRWKRRELRDVPPERHGNCLFFSSDKIVYDSGDDAEEQRKDYPYDLCRGAESLVHDQYIVYYPDCTYQRNNSENAFHDGSCLIGGLIMCSAVPFIIRQNVRIVKSGERI